MRQRSRLCEHSLQENPLESRTYERPVLKPSAANSLIINAYFHFLSYSWGIYDKWDV